MARFKIKRIYDPPADADGYRILVDRLWPRGQRKEEAKLDEWKKEIAPSTALRKWFDHRPDRFEAFSAKYREELSTKVSDLAKLRELAKKGGVTLLYAAKDEKVNHASVLMQVLES
ncbi:hypothetical protein GCM10007415_04010 [Parapedobacter pyrenivorans]|uniref:DUF488 domain-containing protein n=1 Tax=Parapedobacter pyrenivorans TaxID=1305674 RepID=A0A917HDY8_9SPHI|nr:DUF488 domain-containing protein [Parapedobacter pyrenivorans]GGG75544.1 hypothetical protein GCM10007415_04010 [Parapedobacter pyrenivorans]